MNDKLQMYLKAIKCEANRALKSNTNKKLCANNILYYLKLIDRDKGVSI